MDYLVVFFRLLTSGELQKEGKEFYQNFSKAEGRSRNSAVT